MRLPSLPSLVPPLFAEEAVGERSVKCVPTLVELAYGTSAKVVWLPYSLGMGRKNSDGWTVDKFSVLSPSYPQMGLIAVSMGGNGGGEHEVARGSYPCFDHSHTSYLSLDLALKT